MIYELRFMIDELNDLLFMNYDLWFGKLLLGITGIYIPLINS